jgi:uncharacterized membrane protein YfcA
MHDLISDAFFSILAAGFFVGVVVGLTGMGGGALMTPILVFSFGVPPLAAVSSDAVASFFMKRSVGWYTCVAGSCTSAR